MSPPYYTEIQEQIVAAYLRMAKEANYHPEAPSDGLGSVAIPADEIDDVADANRYAMHWWDEEDDFDFFLGCCDFEMRPAVIFAVEAVRQLNGGVGGRYHGLKLLKMAVAAVQAVGKAEDARARVRKAVIFGAQEGGA